MQKYKKYTGGGTTPEGEPVTPPPAPYKYTMSTDNFRYLNGKDDFQKGQSAELQGFTDAEYEAFMKDKALVDSARESALRPALYKKLGLKEGEAVPTDTKIALTNQEVNNLLKDGDYADYYGAVQRMSDLYGKYGTNIDLAGDVEFNNANQGEARNTPVAGQAYGFRHDSQKYDIARHKPQTQIVGEDGKVKSVFSYDLDGFGYGRAVKDPTTGQPIFIPKGQPFPTKNEQGLEYQPLKQNIKNASEYQTYVQGKAGGVGTEAYSTTRPDILLAREAAATKAGKPEDLNTVIGETKTVYPTMPQQAFGGPLYPDGGTIPYSKTTGAIFSGDSMSGDLKPGMYNGSHVSGNIRTEVTPVTPQQYASLNVQDLQAPMGYKDTYDSLNPTQGAYGVGIRPSMSFQNGGYLPQYGFGQDLAHGFGKALTMAAPIAGMVPGLGTAVGAAAGAVGAGLQNVGTGAEAGEVLGDALTGGMQGAMGAMGNMNPQQQMPQQGYQQTGYAYGGNVGPDYEAEGGEVIQHQNQMPHVYGQGGLTQNSSDASMIKGPRHSGGGVKMSGGDRIFSDRIKAPGTKKTYADLANKITKKKGKYEKDLNGSDKYAKKSAELMVMRLDKEMDELFNSQEAYKQTKLQEAQMKYGGCVPKYNNGGPIEDPRIAYLESDLHPFQGPNPSQPGFGQRAMNFAKENDLGYKAMAYAPSMYNIGKGIFGKPQELNAEEFQNPYEAEARGLMANRRYDVDPQLQANQNTYNTMNKNIASGSGGSGGSYLSNLGAAQIRKQQSDASAYSQKNNMDNQYMAQQAQMDAQMGAQRAATNLNIQNINDQNKAAHDNYLQEGLTGMSGIAQNNRMMNNQANADQTRANTLGGMFPDYTPELGPDGRPTGRYTYKQG